MRRLVLTFLSCFLLSTSFAQKELQNPPVPGAQKVPQSAGKTVTSRIVLIGDAGQFVNGKAPVMSAARATVPFDEKTTVVYLGDNIYRQGLPDDQSATYEHYKAVVDSQANIANGTAAQVYFIPGNHDWKNGAPDGFSAILRQERYINTLNPKQVHFLPKDGCPGPELVNIAPNVAMIIMDSQWWLQQYEKPGLESDCESKTEAAVLEEIKDMVAQSDRKLLIFADHHPFRSNGEHGGYYTLKQHIFPFTDAIPKAYIPLPVVGSIYPITRSVFGTIQDMKNPVYSHMIDVVEKEVRKHPFPVFVAGHEHALQYFTDSQAAFIVSGSGCKLDRVSRSRKSDYVADSLGFVVVTAYDDNTSDVQFYTVTPDGEEIKATYGAPLHDFSKLPEIDIPIRLPGIPEASFKDDSVTVAASFKYSTASKLKRFIMGNNYRDVWEQPVKMKIFRITEEKGGLRVVGKGGGQQTKSLKLVDKTGREWTLRTIDKDPESVLPEGFKATFAKSIVQDVISSSHPYAPLTVPIMADAMNIFHTNPEIVFVPNDLALGYYRPLFANQVCLFEQREPVPEGMKARSTAKTLNKMIEENDNLVDQATVLRARLLDIFIGDWDRHFDQWKFAVEDTGRGKLFEPIPRDRDQVYFNNDGLLLRLATRKAVPKFSGFKHTMHRKKTNYLGFNSRYFDRTFLTGLDANDWQKGIHHFDSVMTDSLLEAAVAQLPPEIYALSGPEILSKLKDRRQQMPKQAMSYYHFLSKYVDVLGSHNHEVFQLSKSGDTGIRLKVFELKKNGIDTDFVMYDRIIDPKITEEVRLYGFNKSDKFVIDPDVESHKMKVRLIGGKGKDTFDLKGNIKNFVYDLKEAGNDIEEGRRTEDRMTDNPTVNNYDGNEFKFNRTDFPSVSAGYNAEYGLLVGGGIKSVKYGFRKDPYQRLHKLTALTALREKALRITYQGEFIDLIKQKDLVINADFQNPTLSNFYGLGNETKVDPDKDLRYYRVRYNFLTADVLLRKRLFNNVLSLSAGPTAYYYFNNEKDNGNRILAQPELVGLNYNEVYQRKVYVGGRATAVVNNLNSTLFPTRGIEWTTDFIAMGGAYGNAHPYARLQSEMNVYASLSDPAKLVAVMRLGGGHIFTKDYEYFQALGIGQSNYLRGFRRNRFSGQSMAYGSLELRAKLFDVNSYILPGSFGVVGFGDAARVWTSNDVSAKWHFTPGGGFYYIPFDLLLISTTIAFSEEQALFNLTIGTRFNLTF